MNWFCYIPYFSQILLAHLFLHWFHTNYVGKIVVLFLCILDNGGKYVYIYDLKQEVIVRFVTRVIKIGYKMGYNLNLDYLCKKSLSFHSVFLTWTSFCFILMRSCVCSFTFYIPTVGRAKPDWNQEPRIQSEFSKWGSRRDPSVWILPGCTITGSWIKSDDGTFWYGADVPSGDMAAMPNVCPYILIFKKGTSCIGADLLKYDEYVLTYFSSQKIVLPK